MRNAIEEALNSYYNTQYVQDEDSPDYDESAVIFDNGIPLADRKGRILEKLEKLLAEGVDPNDAPDGEYPLMRAVANLDAPMVSWLIQHGADCRKWLAEGEELEPYERNWYLEDLDITMLNESFVTNANRSLFQAAFDTACVLVKEGGLQEPFYGYCIQVTENREIIGSQAQVKF